MSDAIILFNRNLIESKLRIWKGDLHHCTLNEILDLVSRIGRLGGLDDKKRHRLLGYAERNIALPTTYSLLALTITTFIEIDS